MRRARLLPSCGLALSLLAGGLVEPAAAQASDAVPAIEIRQANTRTWGTHAGSEQQPGLHVTFFVRVTNTGSTTGSFSVRGSHGGAAFGVRYLHRGAGDRRITGSVVDGSYELEDVRPGGTRVLRLRVKVAGSARIDRTRELKLTASSSQEPAAVATSTATVRSVTKAFARAGGVTLRAPAAVTSITFHESLFPTAGALRPLGRLVRNANPSKFDPPANTAGPPYVVMASRGRPTPATSSTDDVVGADEPVLAPVSGTVIRVTRYRLYCTWDDVRVAIRPDAAPQRTVQVFHLVNPRVRRGDRVLVSHTVLGRARSFPFRSQTQDHGLGGRHVHMEVELDGSTPLPGCGATTIRRATYLP